MVIARQPFTRPNRLPPEGLWQEGLMPSSRSTNKLARSRPSKLQTDSYDLKLKDAWLLNEIVDDLLKGIANPVALFNALW